MIQNVKSLAQSGLKAEVQITAFLSGSSSKKLVPPRIWLGCLCAHLVQHPLLKLRAASASDRGACMPCGRSYETDCVSCPDGEFDPMYPYCGLFPEAVIVVDHNRFGVVLLLRIRQ